MCVSVCLNGVLLLGDLIIVCYEEHIISAPTPWSKGIFAGPSNKGNIM